MLSRWHFMVFCLIKAFHSSISSQISQIWSLLFVFFWQVVCFLRETVEWSGVSWCKSMFIRHFDAGNETVKFQRLHFRFPDISESPPDPVLRFPGFRNEPKSVPEFFHRIKNRFLLLPWKEEKKKEAEGAISLFGLLVPVKSFFELDHHRRAFNFVLPLRRLKKASRCLFWGKTLSSLASPTPTWSPRTRCLSARPPKKSSRTMRSSSRGPSSAIHSSGLAP